MKRAIVFLSFLLLGQAKVEAATLYNQIPDMQSQICIQLIAGKEIPLVVRDVYWNMTYDLPMLSNDDKYKLTAALLIGAVDKFCPQFKQDVRKLVNPTQ